MKMKRNEVYTPFGNFPMRDGVYEANKRLTDLEVLEGLYIYGDVLVHEMFTEALHRGLITGFETKSEIDAMIYEMRIGLKPEQPKQKTLIDLFNEVVERS